MARSHSLRLAAGVAALAGVLALAAPAHAATSSSYVALGDSYAAGDGAGSYLSDGTDCHRSLRGYPGVLAQANGLALNLQACSGAVVEDVESRQLGALSASTGYVTITVGGNDIGFASVLTTCAGWNTTDCLNAVTEAERKITTELPAKLDRVYRQVKAKAPNAKIVATGYPRLFNGRDCHVLTFFNSTEMARLNAGADRLASTIQGAAARAGIGYADVRAPFVGHAVCDSTPWINNVKVFSMYESYHPNAAGYSQGYTPPVRGTLQPTASGARMTVTTGGVTSSDTRRGTLKVANR